MGKKRTTIGQMRHRIKIQDPTDSPFGEYSLQRSYSLVAERWARKIDVSGVAERDDRGVSEGRTHRYIIREGVEVDADMLIEENGVYYEVLFVQKLGSDVDDPREQFIGIDVRLQGDTDAYKDPSPEEAPQLPDIPLPPEP